MNNNLIKDKKFIQLIIGEINTQIGIKLEELNETLKKLSSRIKRLEKQTKADKKELDGKINKLENKGFNTWNEVHNTLEDIKIYFDSDDEFNNYKQHLKNEYLGTISNINEQLEEEKIKSIKKSIKKKT